MIYDSVILFIVLIVMILFFFIENRIEEKEQMEKDFDARFFKR